jgi:hypothetical protein
MCCVGYARTGTISLYISELKQIDVQFYESMEVSHARFIGV